MLVELNNHEKIRTKASNNNKSRGGGHFPNFFLSPPEGGLDLVTNRQGAIFFPTGDDVEKA